MYRNWAVICRIDCCISDERTGILGTAESRRGLYVYETGCRLTVMKYKPDVLPSTDFLREPEAVNMSTEKYPDYGFNGGWF